MTLSASTSTASAPQSFIARQATERVAPPGTTRVQARVLIADDHMIMRHSVSRLLSLELGLKVVGEAVNGQEAVRLARALRPDIVIMDINMPVMNGIEATFLIMEEHPDTMVVGFSSVTENHIRNAMLGAGAVDLLDKGTAACSLLPAILQLWAERVFMKGTTEFKKAREA